MRTEPAGHHIERGVRERQGLSAALLHFELRDAPRGGGLRTPSSACRVKGQPQRRA